METGIWPIEGDVFGFLERAAYGSPGLVEGVYLMRLRVSNGSYEDSDEVYLISSPTNNVAPKVSILSPMDGTTMLENESLLITAFASDLIGSVAQVAFYADGVLLGTDVAAPYEYLWTPTVGAYTLTARATDDAGAVDTSQQVQVSVEPAPPCEGTAFNGHFSWAFSDDANNPTLTFIPSAAGVGDPTCILYYGTNPSALPGYGVTPNVPFPLNAPQGTRIYFYYTYSYPGLGEQNTAANQETYVVGTCKVTDVASTRVMDRIAAYPNPVTDQLSLDLPMGDKRIVIRTLTGQQVSYLQTEKQRATLEMGHLPAGIYLVEINLAGQRSTLKVAKR